MRRPVLRLASAFLATTVLACAASPPAGAAPRQDAGVPADRTALPTRSPERYVAIGASDTVGVGATDPKTRSWPARVAAKLVAGSTYANFGVSGSLATQARSQQVPAAVAARPTLVSLWLVVNDMNNGVSPAAYRDVLDGLLSELVARTEARIFVGNVPDLTAVPAYRGTDPAGLAAQVSAYNRIIGETAAKHPTRVVVVDLFTGSAEVMTSATVSADGFHPSDHGYQQIADRFLTAMRGAGMRLRD